MAISPDGRVLATGSGFADNVIRLWEIPSFHSLRELTNHEAWIAALKFSPDGQTLASAAADQTIRLWHVPTWQTRRLYRGLDAEMSRICFAPDSRTLFSGGIDGAIIVGLLKFGSWNGIGEVPLVQTGLGSVAVSSECKQWARPPGGSVYLGKMDPGALPIQTGQLGTNTTACCSPRRGISFFPALGQVKSSSGRLIVTGSQASAPERGRARVLAGAGHARERPGSGAQSFRGSFQALVRSCTVSFGVWLSANSARSSAFPGLAARMQSLQTAPGWLPACR